MRLVQDAPAFSTAAIGLNRAEGHQDHVKRLVAWERAHPGGRVLRYEHKWAPLLLACLFPFPAGTGPAFRDLRAAMNELDRAEREGRCPVHCPGGAAR